MYRSFGGGAIGVNVSFEEGVELAAHFGFEGISLDAGYAMESGPETVVQMLDDRSLIPGGWGLPVTLLGPEEGFRAALEKLPAVADVCSRAGGLRCATWVPPASDEMPYEETFELLRGRVQDVAGILKQYDVRFGLEFIGPQTLRAGKKHEFIHTMDGMLELCRAVGTGNVGLLLDCWHLYTSGGSMDDVLKLSDADVVVVHINDAPEGVALHEQVDNVRRLPGETGVIDVPRFLQCLKQIGYTGPVMAEPFSERLNRMEPEEAVRTAKDAIDSVWPD